MTTTKKTTTKKTTVKTVKAKASSTPIPTLPTNPFVYEVFNAASKQRSKAKKVGKYEWRVGEDGNDTVKILKSFITPEALKTLVDFTNIELGYNTVYKEDLTK